MPARWLITASYIPGKVEVHEPHLCKVPPQRCCVDALLLENSGRGVALRTTAVRPAGVRIRDCRSSSVGGWSSCRCSMTNSRCVYALRCANRAFTRGS